MSDWVLQGLMPEWGHVVAQLVEALHYKLEVTGSIPDGVIGIFH
jgi:putative heme iron utilization protein